MCDNLERISVENCLVVRGLLTGSATDIEVASSAAIRVIILRLANAAANCHPGLNSISDSVRGEILCSSFGAFTVLKVDMANFGCLGLICRCNLDSGLTCYIQKRHVIENMPRIGRKDN
jgi:hypothetical protein